MSVVSSKHVGLGQNANVVFIHSRRHYCVPPMMGRAPDSYTRTVEERAKGDNDITDELKREGQAPSTSPVTGSNKTAGSLGPKGGEGSKGTPGAEQR